MPAAHGREPSPANRKAETLIWLFAALFWGGSTLLVVLGIEGARERDALFLFGGMAAALLLLGFIMQLASIKARDTLFELLNLRREQGWRGVLARFMALFREADDLAPNGFSRRVNLQSFATSYAGPFLAVPAYALTTSVVIIWQILR